MNFLGTIKSRNDLHHLFQLRVMQGARVILQEQLLHREFTLLPSECRFYLLTTGTNRCARSFIPYQIRIWDATCDAGWFFIAYFWMVFVTVDDNVNL